MLLRVFYSLKHQFSLSFGLIDKQDYVIQFIETEAPQVHVVSPRSDLVPLKATK